MRTKFPKSRGVVALHVERLEQRRLRAGVVPPLAHGVAVAVAQPYDPAADLAYAHDALGLSGAGQTVAIIDSGIAYDHYALGGGLGTSYRVVGGWDFAEQDANPYDDGPLGYHGTHIAGIVGSSDKTVPGVAPGVDLVALRVFDDSGHGDFDWIESALAWVHDHRGSFENPITTVNLSIGSGLNSEIVPDWTHLEDELEVLAGDGIFVAVAAGNGFRQYGVAGLNYPAASPLVIPVSSVDVSGQLSDFSQRHERVLAAPGELINSTVPDYLYGFDGVTDDFARVSGTSMATPYVAGASVLVREAFASMGQDDPSVADVYGHLVATSDTISDAVTGADYHRLNLRAALDAILDTPRPPMSASAAVTNLGTIEGATLSSAEGEWFEFTAAATSVLLIDGRAAGGVDTVSVLNVRHSSGGDSTGHRIDGEVTTRDASRKLRFVAVRKGQRYRIHVPSSVQQAVLRQLVSLDAGELVVQGDHGGGDVYVSVGPAFVVAARGVREQVSTGGRLRDDWTGPVDVEQTNRGLVVRVATLGSLDVTPVKESSVTASGPSQNGQQSSPHLSQLLATPFIPIDVGFHAEQRFSLADHVPLSEQAADAMFAGTTPDVKQDQRPLSQAPWVLDQMFSETRRRDHHDVQDADLLTWPISDAEELLVDQILSEQATGY